VGIPSDDVLSTTSACHRGEQGFTALFTEQLLVSGVVGEPSQVGKLMMSLSDWDVCRRQLQLLTDVAGVVFPALLCLLLAAVDVTVRFSFSSANECG